MLEKTLCEVKRAVNEDGLLHAARHLYDSADKFLLYPLLHKLIYGRRKGYAVTGIKGSPLRFVVNASDGGFRDRLMRYGIGTELLRYHTHEPLSTRLFLSMLKSGMRCVDAGANIGYFALQEALRVGEEGKVYAVEPVPENYRLLQLNAKLNGLTNIEAYNIAMSDYEGTVEMHLSPASNWASCLRTPLNDGVNMSAPCMDLNGFLAGRKVDVLRMDVEGYEGTIINGAAHTLTHNKMLLFLEVHPLFSREDTRLMLEQLDEFGYRPVHVVTGNHCARQEKIGSIQKILASKRLMGMIFHGFFSNGD